MPSPSQPLQFHLVTKQGIKTWKVSFQLHWLQQFSWLFFFLFFFRYSKEIDGGICYCILFPEPPNRGGGQGMIPGVLVLSSYQKPYTKALGKDGILLHHERTIMHQHAAEMVDMFKPSYSNPDTSVDSCLNSAKKVQNVSTENFLIGMRISNLITD